MIVPGVNLDHEVLGNGHGSPSGPGPISPMTPGGRTAIGSKPAHGGTPMQIHTPLPAETSGGYLDNVNPYFGAAAFFAAALIKLHPYGKVGGLLIGVGGAVINYGSQASGDGTTSSPATSSPTWLQPHF